MKTAIALLPALLLVTAPTAVFAADQSPAGRVGDKAKATRTVKIELTEYSFSQQQMDFKAGETVKFVLSNNGKLKHEMTIGTAEEQQAHRKAMQDMSDTAHGGHAGHDDHAGHGHHGMDHDAPAGSIHIGPGETKELVWQFTTAGKLQYACNYPGHADLGMEGTIAVK
jgi:uncharacterized cupredoxin-like copper-binding protein